VTISRILSHIPRWVAGIILTAPFAQLAAQASAAGALATIVQVPDLGATDRRAVILRRADGEPPNVVLVSATTTAADLARAMGALVRSVETRGPQVQRDIRAYVVADTNRTHPLTNEGRARQDLVRLSTAPVYNIDGVGPGKAITVWLVISTGRKR
jgi:hypothetical protein